MPRRLRVRSRNVREERGAAMIEFVIVMPLFLFLIFFLIGIATSFSYRQSLSQAATEGARAGAVRPVGTSTADREQAALTAINSALHQSGGCSSSGLVCTVTRSTVNGEDVVTVSLRRDMEAHPLGGGVIIHGMPLISDFLPQKLGYTASAQVAR